MEILDTLGMFRADVTHRRNRLGGPQEETIVFVEERGDYLCSWGDLAPHTASPEAWR